MNGLSTKGFKREFKFRIYLNQIKDITRTITLEKVSRGEGGGERVKRDKSKQLKATQSANPGVKNQF